MGIWISVQRTRRSEDIYETQSRSSNRPRSDNLSRGGCGVCTHEMYEYRWSFQRQTDRRQTDNSKLYSDRSRRQREGRRRRLRKERQETRKKERKEKRGEREGESERKKDWKDSPCSASSKLFATICPPYQKPSANIKKINAIKQPIPEKSSNKQRRKKKQKQEREKKVSAAVGR